MRRVKMVWEVNKPWFAGDWQTVVMFSVELASDADHSPAVHLHIKVLGLVLVDISYYSIYHAG
jgi:hypothetical protein